MLPFTSSPEYVEIQQVAQFLAQPIEIVEYQLFHSQCTKCKAVSAADWSHEIIPGQDLGVRLSTETEINTQPFKKSQGLQQISPIEKQAFTGKLPPPTKRLCNYL